MGWDWEIAQDYDRKIDYGEDGMDHNRWLRTQHKRIHGYLGTRIRGYNVQVDIVDACPMRCPTCPTGMETSRDGHRMSIDLFRRILDKMQSEVKVRRIQLYRWGDPLLHKELHKFIEECRHREIPVTTSSVLQSYQCDFEKVFAAGPEEFRLSFTGWEHMHEYQKNATAERFVMNLERLSRYPRNPLTRWSLFFHLYRDNVHELPKVHQLCKDFNLQLVFFPATYMMYDRIITRKYDEADMAIINRLLETPEENIARIKNASDYCPMQSKEITLDSYGNMQLCQLMYPPEYRMGNFLEVPLKELRKKIMRHAMCPNCKAAGVPGYTLIFAQPIFYEDPVAIANKGKY